MVDNWSICGMIMKGRNKNILRKLFPMLLCPPQFSRVKSQPWGTDAGKQRPKENKTEVSYYHTVLTQVSPWTVKQPPDNHKFPRLYGRRRFTTLFTRCPILSQKIVSLLARTQTQIHTHTHTHKLYFPEVHFKVIFLYNFLFRKKLFHIIWLKYCTNLSSFS